mmetsp:Transcript_2178/g.6129  ORF Transcript_2178/g.6129 Transcript_2178/m.6129 type:complete len:305 (+) Transcript_2178:138-1052(+)
MGGSVISLATVISVLHLAVMDVAERSSGAGMIGSRYAKRDCVAPELITQGAWSENPPLVIKSNETAITVVLCRTPKAGSLALRSIALASVRGGMFAAIKNVNAPDMPSFATLPREEHPEYLWGKAPEVRRLAFVRHPVGRILHGWLMMRPWGSPTEFTRFSTRLMVRLYDDTCQGKKGVYLSVHKYLQHVLPPQHCRCSMPCGVQWEVHRIEDTPIQEVLAGLVPSHLLPPLGSRTNTISNLLQAKFHKVVDEPSFLTPRILDHLNNLTRKEQHYFGYKPYVPKPPLHGASEELQTAESGEQSL